MKCFRFCFNFAFKFNLHRYIKVNATEEQRSIWAQGPPFKPSLLNTVVFLVETVQRVCVMLVNYKGRPHMMGAIENKTLLISLAGAYTRSR